MKKLLNKYDPQIVALHFGSKNGTIAGIASTDDRERCKARIAYEEFMIRLDLEVTAMCFGSVDWTFAGIASKTDREAAQAQFLKRYDAAAGEGADLLRFPATLRSTGSAALLKVFESSYHLEYVEGDTMPDRDDVAAADFHSLTAIDPYRAAYTALVFGADDEKADSVPAKSRAGFDDAQEKETEFNQQWLERNCKRFGSASGLLEDFPNPAARAKAIRRALVRNRAFSIKAKYELELRRIEERADKREREREAADFG